MQINPQERMNAELYYLSCITREIENVPENQEAETLAKHPQYEALCRRKLHFGLTEATRWSSHESHNPH